MSDTDIPENSLVLYKQRPARVRQAGEKLTLELDDGETVKVRSKDVTLLHPGPLSSLAALRAPAGDPQTAWEILAGETTTLEELAELAFGAFTPGAAWAAWQLASEGLYFRWGHDGIEACTADEMADTHALRAAEAAEKRAWEAFLARARAGKPAPEDRRYLRDVEDLALGHATRSRVLRTLAREESPENAHATLLEFDVWDETVNPHPIRLGLDLKPPELPLPAAWRSNGELPGGPRQDLTHLAAYAIDDATTETPDDAVSFEPAAGDRPARIWVHVADAAALVAPDSELDLEARTRGVTHYLPETVTPMLPPATTPLLGLGLTETSPALSFGITVNGAGQITDVVITPSLVRVSRLTYEEADAQLAQPQLAQPQLREILDLCVAYETRRRMDGAISFDMPEVSVRVRDGEVTVRSIPNLRSRFLVENTMVMAGEAVAAYAQAHGIPVPFATQDPPDTPEWPADATLSELFALRRTLKRSQYRSMASRHSGLGLPAYVQVTSPLRRYLDLVTHQQLRGHLTGAPLLTAGAILERIGEVEPGIAAARQAEQLSNRHWLLVHLARHPDWRGRGVLVDRRGNNGVFIIPELALEAQARPPADLPLDGEATLALRSVDLARQDARFKVEP